MTVTNTTKRVYGSIDITKILAGGAASPANLPANTAFGGTWSCKYGTPVVASGTWTVTVSRRRHADGPRRRPDPDPARLHL